MSRKSSRSNSSNSPKSKDTPASSDATANPDTDTLEVSPADQKPARDEIAVDDAAPRSSPSMGLFAAAMATALISAAGVWMWARGEIDSLRAEKGAPAAQTAAPASADANSAARLAKLDEQVATLQQQIDTWRREQLLSQKELRESIERVASAAAGAPQQPHMVPMNSGRPADQPGVERMAEMLVQVTPTQKEFIQLKERNRLTAYADEVIATGLRKPLETIVEYMRNPESDNLQEAAQVEYMRAVRAIQTLQREDPGYRLPVPDLFKDSGVRNEADLKPDMLFKLLEDTKQPWEVRVRAAILLRGSETPDTNSRLIRCIKEDPHLDVAKHAQISFEQRVGRRFRMFDIPAIEAWWKEQGN